MERKKGNKNEITCCIYRFDLLHNADTTFSNVFREYVCIRITRSYIAGR